MKIVAKMDSKPAYHVRHLGISQINGLQPKGQLSVQLNSQLNSQINTQPNGQLNGQLNSQSNYHANIGQQLLNGHRSTANGLVVNQPANPIGKNGKPAMERGASWSYSETKALLSFWGQDLVQRQLTNSKRTRHVWASIADHINKLGYQRTAEQVRTRVFNMIAEYRRIMKQPTEEKKKKCCFFNHLHRIYQAKDASGVRAALDNYEEEFRFDSNEFSSYDENEENLIDNSTTSDLDEAEVFSYSMSPSHCNGLAGQSTNGYLNEMLNGTNRQLLTFNFSNFSDLNGESDAAKAPNQIGQDSLANSVNGDLSDQHLSNDALIHQNSNDPFTQKINSVNLNNQLNNRSNGHLNSHLSGALDGALNVSPNKSNKQRADANSLPRQPPPKKHRPNENSFYLSPADVYPVDTAALLIDRMFAQISKDTEAKIEWIKLEQSRLLYEEQRRKEDIAREERREKAFFEVMFRIQEIQFAFLSDHIASLKETGDQLAANLKENFKEQMRSRIAKELDAVNQSNDAKSNDVTEPKSSEEIKSDDSQFIDRTERPSDLDQTTTETTNELKEIHQSNSPQNAASLKQPSDVILESRQTTVNCAQTSSEVTNDYQNMPDSPLKTGNQSRPSMVIQSSQTSSQNSSCNSNIHSNIHSNSLLARQPIKHGFECNGNQLPKDLVEYVIDEIDERNANFGFNAGIHHEEVV